jgi:hypothetical protein
LRRHTEVFGNTVYCLDRDGRNRQIQIDTSEYMFKLSLIQRKYDQAGRLLRTSTRPSFNLLLPLLPLLLLLLLPFSSVSCSSFSSIENKHSTDVVFRRSDPARRLKL